MALVYTPYQITGISTDTKPTNVPTGITFFETDTNIRHFWTGTAWLAPPIAQNANVVSGNNIISANYSCVVAEYMKISDGSYVKVSNGGILKITN